MSVLVLGYIRPELDYVSKGMSPYYPSLRIPSLYNWHFSDSIDMDVYLGTLYTLPPSFYVIPNLPKFT
jgi:hypothetical protein